MAISSLIGIVVCLFLSSLSMGLFDQFVGYAEFMFAGRIRPRTLPEAVRILPNGTLDDP